MSEDTGRKEETVMVKKWMQTIAVWVMSLTVVFTLLFSAFFLVEEAEHDCTGEDCPVCDCLTWCSTCLHQLYDGTVMQAVSLLVAVWCLVVCRDLAEGIVMPTLVTWKVRLNP